ncbi:type VI secretion system Vgr family protein [Cupriavidus sp. SW-Y-13]|uniref:type VI secretion system Vgr family protein n=1 Tax=Cupriavidus sp. SW-Y-13 TaxID=2653854 RepID=UPI0013657F30|nr:type VI secretion system Vgr family protein [Cupriavidus sp. SW-Y-13]MWL87304.1 type VI secretion system tip protein VgrG [Cupriavidus sp. SW-Y-13]
MIRLNRILDFAAQPLLPQRTVTIKHGQLPTLNGEQLTVARLKGREDINALFAYEVELHTPDRGAMAFRPDANVDLPSMQGKEVSIEIQLDGTGIGTTGSQVAGIREITGLVQVVRGPIPVGRQFAYRLTLRPWLWLATLTTNYRIFQQNSVVEILDSLLANYTFPVEKRLDVARYPKREYQVQYGETDFAFFRRLTEEWGISWFFEHAGGGHRLVLTDNNGAFRRSVSPAYHTLRWQPTADRIDEEHLFDFRLVDQLVSGRWTANDYDFAKPRANLTVGTADPRATGHSHGEVVEWPGGHAQPATDNDPWLEGDHLSRIRMESIRQHGSRASGRGNLRSVVPGCTFTLANHPSQQANREYLVYATQLELEDVAQVSGQEQQWRCEVEFEAQPTTEIFRPDRSQSAPRTFGPQTATVVGPENQELWVDQFGRVKVQFHWDRIGQGNEHSSCWVRVASGWQGDYYGSIQLPRIGQEVIVDFLTGNADLPVIVGRVANRLNMPMWSLPTQHALSGFRSKELFGERHNTFVQDDTPHQIQTQIGSDHLTSMLSMGYMVRIRDHAGRKDKRGEGFELRTDGWGATRAGSGLLITTERRDGARGHHKDLTETATRLDSGQDIHCSLAESADIQHALAGEQVAVCDALSSQADAIRGNGEQDELSQPFLVLASQNGIAMTAGRDLHLHSDRHTAITSGQHLTLAASKSFVASARERFVLFARKQGLRFIAAKGKIEVRAQNDGIEAIAEQVLRVISAQDRIEIVSPQAVALFAGGSFLKVADGDIVQGTAGTWRTHAATHDFPGAKSLRTPVGLPASDVCLPCAVEAAQQGAMITRRSNSGREA